MNFKDRQRILEEKAKIKCGHGRSLIWCTDCRKNKVSTSNVDKFQRYHSFKTACRIIKKRGSVSK